MAAKNQAASTDKDGTGASTDEAKTNQERANAEASADTVYEVSLSDKTTSVELVAILEGGERRAFRRGGQGQYVTADEREQLRQVKVSALHGGKVQALNFREVS